VAGLSSKRLPGGSAGRYPAGSVLSASLSPEGQGGLQALQKTASQPDGLQVFRAVNEGFLQI